VFDIWQGERWIALLDGADPVKIALNHHLPDTTLRPRIDASEGAGYSPAP
jgi:hypothetical protein